MLRTLFYKKIYNLKIIILICIYIEYNKLYMKFLIILFDNN